MQTTLVSHVSYYLNYLREITASSDSEGSLTSSLTC